MKRGIVSLLWLFLFFSAAAGPPSGFVENRNQWTCDVHFVSRIPGGNMLLRESGFRYLFLDQQHLDHLHHHAHNEGGAQHEHDLSSSVNGVMVDVTFVGASLRQPVATLPSKEYYNFYLGNDPSRWSGGLHAYSHIQYAGVYPNVDLHIYSLGSHIKYDMMVKPEGDPRQVRLRYDGASTMSLRNGNLYAHTDLGDIIEKRPYAYQIIAGDTCEVAVEFVLSGNEISFDFPDGYDPCYELVIDPMLIFSTFSGSAADNWGSTATPGERGSLYSAGVTNHFVNTLYSGEYPATPGAFQTEYGGLYDIGILKYDSAGHTLLYASYMGGSESESAHSLVVNSRNELVILGTTSSWNFATSLNAYQRDFKGGNSVTHVVTYGAGSDMIVARISQDGKTLLASTFLGGTNNDGLNTGFLRMNYGDELRGDVITDEDGNIYVSSVTRSPDFAGMTGYNGGYSDAVVIKMPPTLDAISWMKYVGGEESDAAHTIKLDSENRVYVAGGTASADFPVTPDAYQSSYAGDIDGWVAVFSNSGDLEHGTYTGFPEYDQVYFLDLNAVGEVYVYGQTSGSHPVTSGVYSEPGSGQFIQKFSNDLSRQEFYTVFGSGKGFPDISPTAFMVSDCNYLYMAGWGGILNGRSAGWNTSTRGLAVSDDALQKTTTGHDFYFIVLSEDAKERLYATFLGGPQTETHIDGGTSRFDKSGIVYHAVCAGCRGTDGVKSSDFPTTAGAHSRTNKSENCNNAAFKFDLSSLRATLVLKGSDKLCLPATASFDNISLGGEMFIWDFGDGTPETTTFDRSSVSHTYRNAGAYTVWLKAIDQGTCRVRDSVSTRINVFVPKSVFPDDAAICEGNSYRLVADGGVNYHWRSEDGTVNVSGPDNSLTVNPLDSTKYYLTITEATGCQLQDSLWVNVIPKMNPEFDFERMADCSMDIPELRVTNLTDSLWESDSFYFDFGDGTTSDLDDVIHTYSSAGQYNVRLVAVREFCVFEKVIPMAYGPLKYPNVITPGGSAGKNDAFRIQFGDDPGKTPLDYALKTQLAIYDRWGRPVYETDNYLHDWNGTDVSGGVYYYHVKVEEHESCRGWLHVVK